MSEKQETINVVIIRVVPLEILGQVVKVRLRCNYIEPSKDSQGRLLCIVNAEDADREDIEYGQGYYTFIPNVSIENVPKLRSVAGQISDGYIKSVKAYIMEQHQEAKKDLEDFEEYLETVKEVEADE